MPASDELLAPLINDLIAAGALNCMGCGYDLRGQIGNPRCCPECGRKNRLEEIVRAIQPNEHVDNNLELVYVFCILPTILLVLGIGVIGVFSFASPFGLTSPPLFQWMGAAIGTWIVFAAICGLFVRFHSGWFVAYCLYTVATLSFSILIAGGVAVVIMMAIYPVTLPLLIIVPLALYFLPWHRIPIPAFIRSHNSPYARGRRRLNSIGIRLRMRRRKP